MTVVQQRNLLGLATVALAIGCLVLADKNKNLKAANKTTFDAMSNGSLSYMPQNKK